MTRAFDSALGPAEIRRRLRRPRLLLAGLACYGFGGFALWTTLGCGSQPGEIHFDADPATETQGVSATAISFGTCDASDDCIASNDTSILEACGTPIGPDFDSWSCECSHATGCLDADQCLVFAGPNFENSCTAYFCAPAERRSLSVTLASGRGKVEGRPGGISLKAAGETGTAERCSGAEISFTRTPAVGWLAGPWTGDPGCADSLTLTQNLACTTTFFQPKLSVAVLGSGTVTSFLGIACREGSLPADCERIVGAMHNVDLDPKPDPGAVFQSWGGACAATAACTPMYCYVDVPRDTQCTATFSTVAVGAGGSGVIEVISVADDESFGDMNSGTSFGQAGHGFAASADLSRVAFRSRATNLGGGAVPAGRSEPFYLRDRAAGTTTFLSETANSTSSNNLLALSADGRFAAFEKGVNFGDPQVWLLDLSQPGATAEKISIFDDPADVGRQSRNGGGTSPSISANGRHVVYLSESNAGLPIVAVYDACFGAPPLEGCTPHRVRITNPQQRYAISGFAPPRISADGRYVYFIGAEFPQVFGPFFLYRHDRDADGDGVFDEAGGTATFIESPDPGGSASLDSIEQVPFSIDASGRYLAFGSLDPDLPGGLSGGRAAFYRDTCAGAPPGCVPGYHRLSVRADGSPGEDSSFPIPVLSASGRHAAFTTTDPWLVGVDPSGPDAFVGTIGIVRDTCIGASACTPANREVTLRSDGVRPTDLPLYDSPIVSADGGLGAFVGSRGDFFPAAGTVRDVLLTVTGFVPELGGTPTISARTPASAPQGSAAFYLTVEGSGFVPGAQGLVGLTGQGLPRHTVFVSRERLQVLLDEADLATPGVRLLEVRNPGGNGSGPVSFVVN
jgi:hypothetical protein